jgi:hypothetical protein
VTWAKAPSVALVVILIVIMVLMVVILLVIVVLLILVSARCSYCCSRDRLLLAASPVVDHGIAANGLVAHVT